MIVVNASALIELLLQTPAARSVSDQLFRDRQTLHAPHLLDVEVAQVIRRYVLSGDVSEREGSAALIDLAEFPIQRYAHTVLLNRIWELRSNITAYDAAYVALAEALDATLVTLDRKLAASVDSFINVVAI
ncbi:MAG: type II toxin-antitoxin system VapC family toxin [Alphaproteobacteria bacterium]